MSHLRLHPSEKKLTNTFFIGKYGLGNVRQIKFYLCHCWRRSLSCVTEVLQQAHPETAIFRGKKFHDKISAGKELNVADKLKAWQTFLQTKEILKFPGRFSSGKNVAFPSMLLEEEVL